MMFDLLYGLLTVFGLALVIYGFSLKPEKPRGTPSSYDTVLIPDLEDPTSEIIELDVQVSGMDSDRPHFQRIEAGQATEGHEGREMTDGPTSEKLAAGYREEPWDEEHEDDEMPSQDVVEILPRADPPAFAPEGSLFNRLSNLLRGSRLVEGRSKWVRGPQGMVSLEPDTDPGDWATGSCRPERDVVDGDALEAQGTKDDGEGGIVAMTEPEGRPRIVPWRRLVRMNVKRPAQEPGRRTAGTSALDDPTALDLWVRDCLESSDQVARTESRDPPGNVNDKNRR